MAVRYVDRVGAMHGTTKSHTITYATMKETPINLQVIPYNPNSTEPATVLSYVFTIEESDYPVVSGLTRYVDYDLVFMVVAAGRNVSGTNQNAFCRIYRNGTLVTNGSVFVGGSSYFTLGCGAANFAAGMTGVAPGDTLELRLWQGWASAPTTTTAYADWAGLFVMPTRILKGRSQVFRNVAFTTSSYPNSPNVGTANNSGFTTFINDQTAGSGITTSFTYPVWATGPTYGLYRLSLGDLSGAGLTSGTSSSTVRPMNKHWLPTTITWTPIPLV